jgi:catechol 2,3-dioxygenase-like lactoylglutathione lyase family enzyme
MATLDKIWMNFMQCDNVLLIVFGKPDVTPPPPWWPAAPLKTLQPTKGRPIDHLAFSYRKIEPVYEAMQHAGVKIAETIKVDPKYHFKSFFAEGPDGVLLEIIEEKPVPEGIWD